MKQKLKSFFYIFLPLILGGITSFFLRNSIDFDKIIKPPFAPPAILFPIAWTILYFLIGLSYYFYKKEFKEKSETDILYYLGLFFNYTWTIIFFIFKYRVFAILWITILILFTALLIKSYFKKKEDFWISTYSLSSLALICDLS